MPRDHFEFAATDLLFMPESRIILLHVFCGDGIADLPKFSNPKRLLFLVPTKEFQVAEYCRRFQGQAESKNLGSSRNALSGSPDLLAGFVAEWVEYSLSIDQHIRDECAKHSLRLLETGGHASIEESFEAVRQPIALSHTG